MKAFLISVVIGFLLFFGTTTSAHAQSKVDDKKLISACNQAAVELEHRRAENELLKEKVAGLEKLVQLQQEQNSLLRDQNAFLAKALEQRKDTDAKMLEAFELQRKEIVELKGMYERAKKAEKRERKLKWVLAAAGIVTGVLLK